MHNKHHTALIARLTALADDELILAHRDAEWTGHAPILEEDIALANLAQDELGHALVWYGLIETLSGQTPDELAMFRAAADFRNVQMVELPKGDWAFTMLRHYLFDAYEYILYAALAASAYPPLAAAVGKLRREEIYHLRHTHVWVERLGLGSPEANRRMQTALTTLWPLAGQLFAAQPEDVLLIAHGDFPAVADLRADWEAIVVPHLTACDLTVPPVAPLIARRDAHTEHLSALLADMQSVARADPAATW